MKIAKYIANAFEANYASLWHCIVSDGHMRFYVRYDADNHIYFAIGQLSIFLFRLHRSKPRAVLTRLAAAQRRMSDVFVKIDSPRDDVRVMSSGMQLHMQHYAIRITDDAINE
ncbi:unnamed protein product [Anisakis simplex]|uniref:Dynein light chain n=1 Tax=Anisakis simplex TaxID=6269 RepID=A0A0M3JPL5_ANISI|nr:unnamed protein product [Anisakis simplex]